jgi:hypothetical protein
MSHELVCGWLGLPADRWPPDHYTLLGLTAGETDVDRIEERVHERLLRLRPFQLTHPDQVTEAMNRLARAFSCLTDPEAKRAYDAALLGDQLDEAVAEPGLDAADPLAWLFGPWSKLAAREAPPLEKGQTVLDWSAAPPPPRLSATPQSAPDWATSPPPPRLPGASTEPSGNGSLHADAPTTAVAVPPAAPEPPANPIEFWAEAARSSPLARRGLGTRRALFRRMIITRRLLRAWERAGQYLNQPEWRLTRVREAKELVRLLRRVGDLLKEFPPFLGEVGQPGFWVASLARQEIIVPIFRALVHGQRQTLARDWRDGRVLLLAHRCFLHDECRALRRASVWGRGRRAIQFLFRDHPSLYVPVGLLALVALTHLAILLIVWLAQRF